MTRERPSPPAADTLGRTAREPASVRPNPSPAAQRRRKRTAGRAENARPGGPGNLRRGARGGGQGDPARTLKEAAPPACSLSSATARRDGRGNSTRGAAANG